jgi:hypothetical protein
MEALENKTTYVSVTIRITRPKFEPDILQTHNQIITATPACKVVPVLLIKHYTMKEYGVVDV